MLGGSLAAWARGGPWPDNDLDLMVRPRDAEAGLRALAEAGMRPERPPEEWLFKAWRDEMMIDLIFYPSGLEMNDEIFARADTLPVLAVAMPVMALEDVLTAKLHALAEHALDYASLLGIARAVRKQIDWSELRARAQTPYAKAFFTLVQELGVAPAAEKQATEPERDRVRVMTQTSCGRDRSERVYVALGCWRCSLVTFARPERHPRPPPWSIDAGRRQPTPAPDFSANRSCERSISATAASRSCQPFTLEWRSGSRSL